MKLPRLAAALLLSCASLAWSAPPYQGPPTAGLIGEAEAAIAAGDDQAAEGLLTRIPSGGLDAMQVARIQLVRAEIGMRRRQPGTVLRSLPPPSAQVVMLAPRMEQLRGAAYFLSGDVVSAVRTLVARERLLSSAGAIADNREQIWNGLVSTPFPASAFAGVAAEEPMTRGWLDLARVLQQGPSSAAIAEWSQRNPGHPGTAKAALVKASEPAPIAAGGG
jgi:outer membrane PBP1 activator LpoA protein